MCSLPHCEDPPMAKQAAPARPVGSDPRQSLRCAIYTRKSSEEGLDQDFNSLDAQREACAAYIVSQRHEGWTLVPDLYDDGGISGGHMNRPGLLQLLDDVKSGKVDVIVVYKVDRLTRSLSDFAKIVDILDGAGASFVSVTQSFNTTSSMGRLTLNVLLSFAQFEREVTGERIRDKFAASKMRGMWMGGTVPFGYEVKDRKLVVDPDRAGILRRIMERYVEIGSVPELAKALAADGVRTRQRIMKSGRLYGGVPFGKGALYGILSNRIFLGEIVHKGVWYPGEHEAIVDKDLFDRVQHMLASNRVAHRTKSHACDPSLLAGMIRDGQGRRMSPRSCRKGDLKYRYYVSVEDRVADQSTAARTMRVAAGEAETAVTQGVTALFNNPAALVKMLVGDAADAEAVQAIQQQAGTLANALPSMVPSELRQLLQAMDMRVVIDGQSISASFDRAHLMERLGIAGIEANGTERCDLAVPQILNRCGHEMRLAISPSGSDAPAYRDGSLVTLIVKAHQARDHLLGADSPASPIVAMGHKHLARMARLAYLAPDIIKAILEGRQPKSLTSRALLRVTDLPLGWADQRKLLGF